MISCCILILLWVLRRSVKCRVFCSARGRWSWRVISRLWCLPSWSWRVWADRWTPTWTSWRSPNPCCWKTAPRSSDSHPFTVPHCSRLPLKQRESIREFNLAQRKHYISGISLHVSCPSSELWGKVQAVPGSVIYAVMCYLWGQIQAFWFNPVVYRL